MHIRWVKGLAVVALVGLAACDALLQGPSAERVDVEVLLTDAAAEHMAAAWVEIGLVELIPRDEDEDPVTLTDDATDGMVDLLQLQGATTTRLAEAEVASGTYSQLRLVVDSAVIELKEGFRFADGGTTRTLSVPSGAQSGISLNLAEGDATSSAGLTFEPGSRPVLVLDFDVAQSFVVQGGPSPTAAIGDIRFTPAIRVAVNDAAGSISGTITVDGAANENIQVQGLTIAAEPHDDGTLAAFQTWLATGQTDGAGRYGIHFVVPGTYTVRVSGYETFPTTRMITVGHGEEVTGIDFEVTGAEAGG